MSAVFADEKVDERTARDIADSVECVVTVDGVQCSKPARWVSMHECGAAFTACHEHRQKWDSIVAAAIQSGREAEVRCRSCRQQWPIPFAWDRI